MTAPVIALKSTAEFPTFTASLERAADRRDAQGVWDGGQWRGWRDLLLQAERTAAALHRHGLRSGDVLAAQLPNSWELLTLHAATARLGALLLPLHSAYGVHEMASLIEQSGAVGLVARGSYRGRDRLAELVDLRGRCATLHDIWVSQASPRSPLSPPAAAGLLDAAELMDPAGDLGPTLPPPPADPHAPLVLLASSGTTSRLPKLCVHSNGGLLGNAAAVAADGGFDATDTIVSASPLSHAFGLLSVHLALVTGGAVGLFDGWDPARFTDTLAAASATAAFAVPAQLRDLLRLSGQRPTGLALREVRTGGAPVPHELADGVRRTLGAHLIVQWGMTEIGAGTYTRPGDPPEATSTVGRPATGAQVRVVDRSGAVAAVGETGELQYRSPYMFRGYFRAPERTRAALTADGWLRCGDLAAIGADGSVHYRGRADELINRGGLKFSALEVEELLNDLPQLAQHAVIPRPDPRLGQRSCLLAALHEGTELSLPDVVAHLTGKGLATYKLPEQLVVVDQLPTTVTGKIARARLTSLPLLQPQPQEVGR
ncbi:class I adenylate-forming enzyme family protein [Streptomyces sp. NPDC050095]|uniref:class I adenylate-forming enzyme family protein n=1 Tax=unclassified Streptomyces TaxID=2593676 RepID=UPI003421EC01